jgi:hypothetical protein
LLPERAQKQEKSLSGEMMKSLSLSIVAVCFAMLVHGCTGSSMGTAYDPASCSNHRTKEFKFLYHTNNFIKQGKFETYICGQFVSMKVNVQAIPAIGSEQQIGTQTCPPQPPIFYDPLRKTKEEWNNDVINSEWDNQSLATRKCLAVLGSLTDNWVSGDLKASATLGHGYPKGVAAIYHHDILSFLKQNQICANYKEAFTKYIAMHEMGHQFECSHDPPPASCSHSCFMYVAGILYTSYFENEDPKLQWCQEHGNTVCQY